MTIIPIRSDNAYVGIAKQSGQGSSTAPTNFVRWIDGTKIDVTAKTEEIWEGDGSRHLSQLIKNMQSVKATIVFYPRPIEIGYFETAAMGIGSDGYTAASVGTTLSGATTAGATTIAVTANTGLTSAGTVTLILSPNTANEEVAVFTTPATGAGPYTLTLVSGSLKNPHNSTDVVQTVATHTIVDQTDGNYYTVEFGLGSLSGGAGPTLRITDCKVNSVKRSAKAGKLLEYSIDVEGIATTLQGSPATVTYEAHSPFLFTQGSWTLNGSTTGDALALESFEIDQKNNLDTGIQTEQLILSALIFGNLTVEVKADLVMQNTNLIALTYFGGPSGTTDSQAIGAGNLTAKFTQPDGFHSVQYNVATLHYDKVTEPSPKKDGKHYKLSVDAKGVSNQTANAYILQTVVTNAKASAY